jgi:very-short-patch-repair endonuclease
MRHKLTTKEFIEKSQTIHGNKYDYSIVAYKTYKSPIAIKCPIHGKFFCTPNNHISQGSGCPTCGLNTSADKRRSCTTEFIRNAKKIHGKKYDYSKTEYLQTDRKVIITCPFHGEFHQSPHNHVHGKQGCPSCYSSKGEQHIERILKQTNVRFVKQKKFKGCVSKNQKHKLSFDFYLPAHNILIEYDGEHHYSKCYFNRHRMTDKELQLVQFRDRIKTKFAKENGIRLLRIPYWKEYKIETILEKAI